MSKYIATLSNNRGDVHARNLFELQSTLCAQLNVPNDILTYTFLREAALGTLKGRRLYVLKCSGIEEVRKVYKRANELTETLQPSEAS
jgi:hypothetical protein